MTPGVRRRMQLQKSQGTQAELRLRKLLHRSGLRFRVHRMIVPGTRRSVDIAFGPSKVAVFVDGCFWHGCPLHYRPPASNELYWHPKIAANRARDEDTDLRLGASGWKVVRVWEHEDVAEAAERIAEVVGRRRTFRNTAP